MTSSEVFLCQSHAHHRSNVQGVNSLWSGGEVFFLTTFLEVRCHTSSLSYISISISISISINIHIHIHIHRHRHIHIHNDYISKQILIMIHTNRGGISSSKRRESDMGHDQHSGGCFMYHRSLGPRISPKGLCLGNDSFKDPYNVM